MRTMNWLGVSLGIATLAAVAQGVGCYHVSSDCEIFACASSSSGTGGGTSSSSSTGGGGTGGTPSVCVPSEATGAVDETCGVFVSSSLGMDDMAADRGSKAKPYKSLGAALAKSGVSRVYACAEQFSEAVTIAAKVELYGGLDCKSWSYVGATAKTKLTADADQIPLTFASTVNGASVEDFAVTAASAKKDGGSSITVIADQATASFARCDLVAGAGKAGVAGTTPTDSVGPNDPTNSDIVGNNGAAACMAAAMQFGGAAKENMLCPAASGGPFGGQGGVGAVNSGSNGDLEPTASMQTALGGVGQPSSDPMNLWDCVPGSGLGAPGTKGNPGAAGPGASGAMSLGTLDKSGYTGIAGQPGGPGSPGQGGGGGGGAKGKMSCAGASGGGGGAGGCGGKGGLGGLPGGASIALVSLGATLSFDKVTIKAGAGGSGGDGGVGQGGGVGGNGGNGGSGDASAPATLAACNGGKGGQGGFGGKGGGGRGGHAISIAYTGAAPSTKGATFTKGTPGKGGAGADMAHNGDDGVQADVQAFP